MVLYSGRKFKIFYSANNPDKELAGKQFTVNEDQLLVMSNEGLFYFIDFVEDSTTLLYMHIGEYDVVWSDQ